MNVYYNPLAPNCKSVRGAVAQNQKLEIRLFVLDGEVYDCYLHLRRDGDADAKSYPLKRVGDSFFVCLEFETPALFWYFFTVNGTVYGKGENLLAASDCYEKYQLTVTENHFSTPEFLKGGVIYQIFPDRFNRSGDFSVGKGKVKRVDWGGLPTFRNAEGKVLNNEFFGGALKGIENMLPYISSLGVTAIYMNPISESYSSHRYDTGNYLKVDSVLGDENDLLSLTTAAKKLGIAFIFDGVFNHTGADSLYFNRYCNYPLEGAFNTQSSKYYPWYTFRDYPYSYESWWDFENLPSINKHSEAFQNFVTNEVLPFYARMGFSGVRLDVVDELSGEFVEKIRTKWRSLVPAGAVIGEVWEDATNKIVYGERRQYFLGKQLDSVMNYPLKDAIIAYLLSSDAKRLAAVMEEQINNYPKCALDVLMNCLSTHDTPRIITVLGRDNVVTDKDEMCFETMSEFSLERGKTLALLAYTLCYTVYGVPSLYYGDEAGMWGNLDPYNRKCFQPNLADECLTNYMKTLGKIRKNEVFRYGETNILYVKGGIFIFERVYNDENIIVAINRDTEPMWLDFDSEVEELIGGAFRGKRFSLSTDSAAIFKTIQ